LPCNQPHAMALCETGMFSGSRPPALGRASLLTVQGASWMLLLGEAAHTTQKGAGNIAASEQTVDSVPDAVAWEGRVSIRQPLPLNLPYRRQRCVSLELAFSYEAFIPIGGLLTQARGHAHALQATPRTPPNHLQGKRGPGAGRRHKGHMARPLQHSLGLLCNG
jgi:hypothetical protein